MNAAKQAFWLFFALFTLACSGLYFASSKPIKRLDNRVLDNTADLVVSNLIVRRFDEKGTLINYLHSPEVQHIPENNVHLLKLPHLLLVQANQPAWEIRSQKAEAFNGGEKITFIKKVVIHQASNKAGQESTVRTERLDYFSKSKIASTELAVSFEQPGSIVHSKGMKAYLEDKRIQLSHARAIIEPKHA